MDKYNNNIEILNKQLDILSMQESLEELLKNNINVEKLKKEIKELKNKINTLLASERDVCIEKYENKIFNEDCLQGLNKIPENSIHLFLSDIPYGINLDEWDVLHNNTNSALLGTSPAQEGKSGFKKRGKPINGWNENDRKINEYYGEWVYTWAQMLYPAMKEGGSVFIFGARRTISSAIKSLEKAGFLMRDMLAWKKEQAHDRRQDILNVILGRGHEYLITTEYLEKIKFHDELSVFFNIFEELKGIPYKKHTEIIKVLEEKTGSKKIITKYKLEILENTIVDNEIKELAKMWKGWKIGNLSPIYEPIAWLFKPYSTVTLTDNIIKNGVGGMNIQECLVNGKSPTNILEFGLSLEEKRNKFHEAQKPVELIEYLIKLTTLENQIVLDAFMGSGTTAVAAKNLNRKYLGFEREKNYYQICLERLNKIKPKNKK